MEKENLENMKCCPRFISCSAPICPLDEDADLRSKLPEEEKCPFCLKKKELKQKGIRVRPSNDWWQFVREKNRNMVNKRILKRLCQNKKISQ